MDGKKPTQEELDEVRGMMITQNEILRKIANNFAESMNLMEKFHSIDVKVAKALDK